MYRQYNLLPVKRYTAHGIFIDEIRVHWHIVTVCVFVRHLFSFYPFYFDFQSARIIFDVSSGFYLWNINKTTA
jgi:hypothetical protein